MFIPKKKVYGEYKKVSCPFCDKPALSYNSQKIPVCLEHKNQEIQEFKCACGETLESKHGKFGPYFSCMRCGNVNFKKAMSVNTVNKKQNKSCEVETRDKQFE